MKKRQKTAGFESTNIDFYGKGEEGERKEAEQWHTERKEKAILSLLAIDETLFFFSFRERAEKRRDEIGRTEYSFF